MSKGNIRFSVIGLGHIGKKHAGILNHIPGAELVSLCDINEPESMDPELENIPFFRSMEELIQAGPESDVISIATPNGMHTSHAIQSLKSGRHVVIEKPMTLKRSDAERIISIADLVTKQVFCIMQNRYSPPSSWLKSICEQGILGRVYLVEVNCYWNRDERYYSNHFWKGKRDLDGGTLFTQFSHFVDLLYWIFGDIEEIDGKFFNHSHPGVIEFEDSGIISFNFKAGGAGLFSYSTSAWDKNFESSITVLSENGTVKIGGQYMDKVEYCHIRDYKMPVLKEANPPNDYGNYKGSAANHQFVFENVIDTLNRKATATTNANDGLMVVDIIERIYRQNTFIK